MTVDIFSITILLLLVGIAIFTLKVYNNIVRIKRDGRKRQSHLKVQIALQNRENILNTEKLTLADHLNESLFKNLFYITRQLLLLQKLILDGKN